MPRPPHPFSCLTDAAAAARLNSARQLEELRSLTAGMAVNRASVDRQRQLLRDIDDELQTLRGEIRTETPAESIWMMMRPSRHG